MTDLLYNPTFISIVAIVMSVLSVGASIAVIILTKKTNERDNARIAQENAKLEGIVGTE